MADTTDRARRRLLSQAWSLAVSRSRGEFPPLPAEGDPDLELLTDRERRAAEEALAAPVHGNHADVLDAVEELVRRTGASEVLVATTVHDEDVQAVADQTLFDLVTGSLAARLRTRDHG